MGPAASHAIIHHMAIQQREAAVRLNPLVFDELQEYRTATGAAESGVGPGTEDAVEVQRRFNRADRQQSEYRPRFDEVYRESMERLHRSVEEVQNTRTATTATGAMRERFFSGNLYAYDMRLKRSVEEPEVREEVQPVTKSRRRVKAA